MREGINMIPRIMMNQKTVGVLLIICSVISMGIGFHYLENDIGAKESQLSSMMLGLQLYTTYQDRAIIADSFKRTIQNIPDSDEKDIDHLIRGFDYSLNAAGDALIGGIGSESSPISHEQFRKLNDSEKLRKIDELGTLLTEKYSRILGEKRSKETQQDWIVIFSIMLQVTGLVLMEVEGIFEGISNALRTLK